MTPNHELILRYVTELNWRVVPCLHGEKRPLCHKPDAEGRRRAFQASNDPDQIRAWLKEYPYANWALACGQASGVIVADAESLSAVNELRGIFRLWQVDFPLAPTALSGGWSAGAHVYFAYPQGRRIRGKYYLRNNIEVRGDGHWIMLPPSLHPSGHRYEWDGLKTPWALPLPPLPEPLIELMAPPPVREYKPLPKEKLGDRYVAAAIEGEAEEMAREPAGGRNDSLFKRTAQLCTRFVANGLAAEQTIREAMLAAGVAAGLDEIEARRTVLSASRAVRARF